MKLCTTHWTKLSRRAKKWLQLASCTAATVLAAACCSSTAQAQVGIFIGRTPPPLRYEARPAIPGPGYNWVDGYWEPWQGRYRWHGGYWQQPPFAGAYWNHPHYDRYDRGWQYHEGYWGHDDRRGYDHHVDDHDHHR